MANMIGLDYFQEAIVLGIDALIFGICLKGYYSYKNTIQALRVSTCERPLQIVRRLLRFRYILFI